MTLSRIEPYVNLVLGRTDVALALLLVMTIAMIVLPLPTLAVDTLIALNLACSAVLVMVAVYISSPLAFSVFPAVVLLTTLFRLALSITTTRLILLEADAGQVVQTFGDFVVGGNVIVGLVIFLIITVVQFIVVTKGAERVAEVTARFSLDALPGKQMAIDGDMRAGIIDADEARRRRENLQKESQLFGSLDGAMKFVKGDAIAGIFITLINIIGGISIGALQQGMSVGEAVQLYTILTVGDGLVAQIPALLIAMTSGIIVTRIVGREGGNLGEDIGRQVLSQPKALMIAAALLTGFAMVPGFPTVVFLALALFLAGLGWLLQRLEAEKKRTEASFLDALSSAEKGLGGEKGRPQYERTLATELVVRLDPALQKQLDAAALEAVFAEVRRRVFDEMGVPGIGVQLAYTPDLRDGQYRILVQDVPVADGVLAPQHVLALSSADALRDQGIRINEDVDASSGYCWVPESQRGLLQRQKVKYLTGPEVLGQHAMVMVERHIAEFMNIQRARLILDNLLADAPEIAKEATGTIPMHLLSETLRRLLMEQVPIRSIGIILQNMLMDIVDSKEPSYLSEMARRALRRQLTHRFSVDGVLHAITFAPDLEGVLGKLNTAEVDGATKQALAERLRELVEQGQKAHGRVVLLVDPNIRQIVWDGLRRDFPRVPVMSFLELSLDAQVADAGTASWKDLRVDGGVPALMDGSAFGDMEHGSEPV